MKKRIALLLSFVLVLSLALCACGGQKENLVGTWTTTVNMAEMFNEDVAADPEMSKYVHLDQLDFVFVLELREDGTCKLSVDPDSLAAAVDQLIAALTSGMEAYFADMFAAQGIQIDLNEALAAMGISMDDLVAELKDELLADSTFDDMSSEAKYKYEDGKMYFSDDLESEINTEEYAVYTLKGDTLTLEQGTMTDVDEELFAYIFPMVLTREK